MTDQPRVIVRTAYEDMRQERDILHALFRTACQLLKEWSGAAKRKPDLRARTDHLTAMAKEWADAPR